MRLIHIILLLVYCHFTMAGAAGAWVMKRDLRTEERYAMAMTDPGDLSHDADGSDDEGGGDASSPGDPDQCHRYAHPVLVTLLAPDNRPVLSSREVGSLSLGPTDITTPPPRA